MRELNLLPPVRRHSRHQEQRFLLVGDILIGLFVSLLIVTLSAVASGIGLWVMIQTIPALSELPQEIKRYQEIQTQIGDRNFILETLVTLNKERITWNPVTSSILKIVSPDIHLTAMSADSKTGKILLAGQAATRNALIVFENRLKTVPGVQQVTSPPGNLLLRENAPFTFEVILDPAKIKTNEVDSIQ